MSIDPNKDRGQQLVIACLLLGKLKEKEYIEGGGFTVNMEQTREAIILPPIIDREAAARIAIGLMEVKGGLPEEQYEIAFDLLKIMYDEEFSNVST